MEKGKYVAVSEAERTSTSEEHFGIRLKDAEFGVSTGGFGLTLLRPSVSSLCSLPYVLDSSAYLLPL